MKYGNEEMRPIWWIENEYSWQMFKNVTRKITDYEGPDTFASFCKRSIEACFLHHQWSLEEWPTNKVSNKIIVDRRRARGARGLKYDDSDSDTSVVAPDAGDAEVACTCQIHCRNQNNEVGQEEAAEVGQEEAEQVGQEQVEEAVEPEEVGQEELEEAVDSQVEPDEVTFQEESEIYEEEENLNTQRSNFDLEMFDDYSDPLAFTQQGPSQGPSQQPGPPGPGDDRRANNPRLPSDATPTQTRARKKRREANGQ